MEIKEIKEMKNKFEEEIREKVREFEERTGVIIERIEIERCWSTGGRSWVNRVEIVLKV